MLFVSVLALSVIASQCHLSQRERLLAQLSEKDGALNVRAVCAF